MIRKQLFAGTIWRREDRYHKEAQSPRHTNINKTVLRVALAASWNEENPENMKVIFPSKCKWITRVSQGIVACVNTNGCHLAESRIHSTASWM